MSNKKKYCLRDNKEEEDNVEQKVHTKVNGQEKKEEEMKKKFNVKKCQNIFAVISRRVSALSLGYR